MHGISKMIMKNRNVNKKGNQDERGEKMEVA